MARPVGSATDPSKGRPPGPPEQSGHRKAVEEYRAGAEFTGQLAIAKEKEIRERWAADGVLAIMEDNTVRLQVCLELYENQILAKTRADELKGLPRLLKDYASLVTRANAELARIHELAKAGDDVILVNALEAAREASGDDGQEPD